MPLLPLTLLRAAALTVAAALASLHLTARAEDDKKDFSPAERLLFMSNQLRDLKVPASLRYSFRKSGSLEDGFDDTVNVELTAQPDGSCCVGKSSFLSGSRSLPMPDLEGIDGNPVTMYFLERDVREMNRLTKGSQNYFRKRIRMAIYNGATLRDVQLGYRGGTVAATEITISPYRDDPMRGRYEQLAGKEYQFLLSDAVPGGIYGIRTRIDDEAAGKRPLLIEELWVDGADRAVTR